MIRLLPHACIIIQDRTDRQSFSSPSVNQIPNGIGLRWHCSWRGEARAMQASQRQPQAYDKGEPTERAHLPLGAKIHPSFDSREGDSMYHGSIHQRGQRRDDWLHRLPERHPWRAKALLRTRLPERIRPHDARQPSAEALRQSPDAEYLPEVRRQWTSRERVC